MGHRRAFELLVMGRPLDAAEAKACGLVNAVVAPGDVEAEAHEGRAQIAALPPKPCRVAPPDARLARRIVARIDDEGRVFKERLQSPEARAAFDAFLNRKRCKGASMSLKGKTLFITGASRGIGLAIALRAARDGANIAIAAKTDEPHPKLEGTIYTAAEQIEKAGGKALPLVVDVRDEDAVEGRHRQDGADVRRHRHLRQQRQRHLAARRSPRPT